MSTTVKN
jgi:glutathione S-transferase